MDWMIGVRGPVGARNFSPHHRVKTGSGAHSPPPSAEDKNAWSFTSTPPIRLHGVVAGLKKLRDNFTFTFLKEEEYNKIHIHVLHNV
jgi:hypothetical protein